jgi:precorrin-6Y C5,15-methyltransferase (decarboxylating)
MRIFMARAEPVMREPASPRRWLSIVGIGEDGVEGLSAIARGLVAGADIVFGGLRHLQLAAPLIRGQARPWPSPFSVDQVLVERGRQVCVLASGDPFFYGVGSVLAGHVAPEETLVVPAPSSFSLAAARLGWAFPEIALVSLHGRSTASARICIRARASWRLPPTARDRRRWRGSWPSLASEHRGSPCWRRWAVRASASAR